MQPDELPRNVGPAPTEAETTEEFLADYDRKTAALKATCRRALADGQHSKEGTDAN